MSGADLQPPATTPKNILRWFRPNVGSALVLATVLGVLTFMLTSDGEPVTQSASDDSAEVQLVAADNDGSGPLDEILIGQVPTPTEPATVPDLSESEFDSGGEEAVPLVTAALESRAEGFGGDAAVSALAATSLITNMGPTEIGLVTNFPAVDYTWQRVELGSAGISETGWLGQLDGQFVSIGSSWGVGAPDGETQNLVTYASGDGISWDLANAYALPSETWVSRIVGNGNRVVAIGESWAQEEQRNEYVLFVSEDGVSWTSNDLSFDSEEGEQVYIQDAVMGPAGIALSVQFETYPEEPPLVLLLEPFEVTLNYARNSYTLSDLQSGEVALSGSLEDIFNWGGNGQSIYDPATGELLTTVPYEVWERAWSTFYGPGQGGSPLPIPVNNGEPDGSPQVVIEYDGFVIEVNDYAGTYTVSDAESGDEIASGTLDELYQGPPPTFVDPETGEILLAVTWDEWHQAEEQAYMNVEYEETYEYDYRSRTSLVTSEDGNTWVSEPIADGTGSSTSYLAATNDGFVAMLNFYEEFGGERGVVWTYSGGTWSSTTATRTDLWLHQIANSDSELLGVGDGGGGQGVWSSQDGVNWVPEFATVPQDDGSNAWLSDVSADASGSVGVLAVRERWSGYGPLVIEQEVYTATFEDGDVALRVVETATGNTVISFSWQEFEDGSAADRISWDGEATSIDLGNGAVMVIPDDEAMAANDSRYSNGSEMGLSVFIKDGNEWKEAVVDVEGAMGNASQLFLADGRILIGGGQWGMEPYYEEPGSQSFVIIVGTRVGE